AGPPERTPSEAGPGSTQEVTSTHPDLRPRPEPATQDAASPRPRSLSEYGIRARLVADHEVDSGRGIGTGRRRAGCARPCDRDTERDDPMNGCQPKCVTAAHR